MNLSEKVSKLQECQHKPLESRNWRERQLNLNKLVKKPTESKKIFFQFLAVRKQFKKLLKSRKWLNKKLKNVSKGR